MRQAFAIFAQECHRYLRIKGGPRRFWFPAVSMALPLQGRNGRVSASIESGLRPTFFCFKVPTSVNGRGLAVSTMDLQDQIFRIAAPIAKALDLELVEVACQGKGAGTVVLITLDKEGGIGIKECEGFHKSLGHALDLAELIPHAYRLEVSSPGLDRPLKHLKDYQRVVGRLLRVKVHEPTGGKSLCVGRLTMVNEEGVRLAVKQAKGVVQEIALTWPQIAGAKQEVEF